MGKLALSISIFCLNSIPALAGEEPPEYLLQGDLSRPKVIHQWLVNHADKADKSMAGDYLKMGHNYMKQRNWSAASKAYGESALIYPAPKTLQAYASSRLRMLGQLNDRNNYSPEKQQSDLMYGINIYKTALGIVFVRWRYHS